MCILGGGFGGLYTAVRLDQLLWPRENKPQVTLIDQSERFVFKPLLYDLLAGVAQPWEVAPAFAQLLSPYNINFVKGAVASVEAQETLNDGGSATGEQLALNLPRIDTLCGHLEWGSFKPEQAPEYIPDVQR